MSYFNTDVIAQVGTPPGRGLVGALRLSGEGAFGTLADCLENAGDFSPDAPKRGTFDAAMPIPLVRFRNGTREQCVLPCPVRIFLMPAPASYTREDVAEIHLPGSPPVLKAGLARLVAAGARPALPGEFTFRAFVNGRLSLAQAEAVEGVIRAGNEDERRAALARLGDAADEFICRWRDRAMDVAARLEAALDFADEDIDAGAADVLAGLAAELEREGLVIKETDRTAETGLPRVAMAGRANAGKSSLLNALLGTDAFLVSPEAHTTRDRVEREAEWHGVRLVAADTPGHDAGGSDGGRLAAERAFRSLGGAEAACWVVDGSVALGRRDADILRVLSGPVVLALNKSDLPEAVSIGDALAFAAREGRTVSGSVRTSAATGEGVDELRTMLADAVRQQPLLRRWNRREALELTGALAHCRDARDELAGAMRLELASESMRRAVESFSRAMGEGYAESALERIFSTFCIGK